MQMFYSFCAIFGCSFVVLQLLMMTFTGFLEADSGEGSFDSDSPDTADIDDSDADGASARTHSVFAFLRILSLRTVTAGMGFFGLAGLGAQAGGLSQPVCILIATAAGLATAVLVYFVYRLMNSFRYNGMISDKTLPGCQGTVHVRIPPARSGSGKVMVTQQERTMEYEAISDDPDLISAGTPIIVSEVLTSNLIVVKRIQ